MDDREHRIRQRAHRLWEEEGRPDGRAEAHWFQAKEIVAVEESFDATLLPADTGVDVIEPIEALTNAGEFPTLTDQGEMQIPHHGTEEPAFAEGEPVNEIETVKRTPEVPPKRRGKTAPVAGTGGAISGAKGSRKRS